GPFAGVIADRANRLTIMRIAQTLSLLQAFALGVLTAAGWINIELIFVLVLINGIIVGFNQPARLSLVSSLVPRANLSTAVAVNSIVFNLARFIGPAIAGLLIVTVGVAAAFLVNALSYLVFLIALARIRLDPETLPARTDHRRSMIADVVEGLRYLTGHPGLGPLLMMSTFGAVGVRCYVELLPGFAAEVFGRGAGGLAALGSAIGMGAVVGGLWLAQRGGMKDLARVALLNSLFMVLAVFGFAAVGAFWAGLLFAGVSGIFMAVSGVATQTVVQLGVDPRLRGRVLSLYGIIVRAGPAAGALIMGIASEFAGLRIPLVVGAGVCLLAWGSVWRRRADVEAALQSREAPGPGA
ncbi:MAG: MFS transporter, partial [Gammaproteobacteria bacterium]|nr:MFS transporter [Gammaproteobacteria bacterium]